VHVEVQGQNQAVFAQRMLVCNYRLYDRYAKPVVSLAVLGEPSLGNHGELGYARWGCPMGLRFPLVTLAHLSARETAGSPADRYQAERGLIRSFSFTGAVSHAKIFLSCSGSSIGC
jgi:hypothetical protein